MQAGKVTTGILAAALALLWLGVRPAPAQHGLILDQQLDPTGKGYTVIRVWGSDYQMGYAQASLLGDSIVQGIEETRTFLGSYYYNMVRGIMAAAVWMPPGIEDEISGMVDCLAISHPSAGVDSLDIKVASTAGEWLYACRSHTCWGRYVSTPVQTLSTRRLDFGTFIPTMNHHVLCARVPAEGAPSWVNLSWPGIVTAATGVNEFGTIVSLHDYYCDTDFTSNRMPRMVACRYALTFATDPDVSTHVDAVYAELRNHELMTGSFFNYYAPEGHGGVIVGNPNHTPDFYYLRKPRAEWHHGEAMITTNAWTDGTYTPADENFGADTYYGDESPKTLESHWDLLANAGNGLHQLSAAYRGRADITVWADGRLDGAGRTPRLEYEWTRLTGLGDMNCDGIVNSYDIDGFICALSPQCDFTAQWPDCLQRQADCNGDGQVNSYDIDSFVALIGGD
ncbi:MAG: dockerin type I domain-containing protein [Planctomycetota bacterium]